MKIRKRIVLLAIILSLLTTTFLFVYIKQVEKQNIINYNTDQVIVAKEDIPVDTRITPDMVELREVAAESVHPDAAMSIDEVIGYVTRSNIVSGEQVLLSRIATGRTDAGLSYKIPDNMRAMTISTNETTSVGGYINIGDKVDILASYTTGTALMTFTQLQNLEVIAKGPSTYVEGQAQGDQNTGVTTSITLLVTPNQAQVLAFAVLTGQLNVTLRSPADEVKVNITEFGTSNFATWRER